jgi:hypothetical protein
MSFIVIVEKVHDNRGAVTNSHEQVISRPNKLLKGRYACVAKVKKQFDNQD